MSESNKRYQVVAGNVDALDCYDATVVDTGVEDEHSDCGFLEICDCFDTEKAKLICDALNTIREQRKGN